MWPLRGRRRPPTCARRDGHRLPPRPLPLERRRAQLLPRQGQQRLAWRHGLRRCAKRERRRQGHGWATYIRGPRNLQRDSAEGELRYLYPREDKRVGQEAVGHEAGLRRALRQHRIVQEEHCFVPARYKRGTLVCATGKRSGCRGVNSRCENGLVVWEAKRAHRCFHCSGIRSCVCLCIGCVDLVVNRRRTGIPRSICGRVREVDSRGLSQVSCARHTVLAGRHVLGGIRGSHRGWKFQSG